MQQLPVRIYRTEKQIVLAAPLAGLEPEDIRITIDNKRVKIDANLRGPGQDRPDVLQAEWSIGPYHREIELLEEVDGALTNATYGNGVLVLTIPKAAETGRQTGIIFTLEATGPARGERVGHAGHGMRPTTTREHRARVAEIRRMRVA